MLDQNNLLQQKDQDIKVKIDLATKFRQFIEVEVLKIIKELIEKKQTSQERIKEIAKTTLDLIKPEMDLETLFQNAVKLDDQLPELAPVVYKIMKEYEEKYEKKALVQVSQMIKKGRYQEAQDLVKRILSYKSRLTS